MSEALGGVTNLGAIVAPGDPDAPVFIAAGGDGAEMVLTRGALDAAADAFARGLVRGGIARGSRVAILSANSPAAIACLLGAMRAGVVPTPVSIRFPPAMAARVLADSGAVLVLCDAAGHALVGAMPDLGVPVARLEALDLWLDPGPFTPVVPRADEAALCLYTSGSTGRPKGVLLSHASHLWVVRTRMAEADLGRERLLIAAPLYHMNALALALLACASGASAVLLPQFEAKAYIEAVSRYRCTWLTAVPPMMAMMLRESETLARADLSSVRRLRMGSAPVNEALAAATRALLPNADIVNAYGTTEGGPIVFDAAPGGPAGSLGRAHAGVEVRLSGPEAPASGVLEMKSPAVMLGYLNRPDLARPITEDGFYVTGDVFRRDADGFFSFVGRSDDMFVSGGENIFPGEVESVLETHPDVLQACVVPVEDAIKGTKPVAFVVRRPGSTLDEAEVKRHALTIAPAFQHPRQVWFLHAMPLTATNKVDRATLRARAEEALGSDHALRPD